MHKIPKFRAGGDSLRVRSRRIAEHRRRMSRNLADTVLRMILHESPIQRASLSPMCAQIPSTGSSTKLNLKKGFTARHSAALRIFVCVLLALFSALGFGQETGGVVSFGATGFSQSASSHERNIQVAAGGSHTILLKAGGTVVCWGRNSSGQ